MEVPLDVVLAYFFRAKKYAASIPVGRRLSWLQSKDEDERGEWVTRFRESTKPLGLVTQEVMQSRDAHCCFARTCEWRE